MFSFRITLPFRIPTFAEVRSLFVAKPNTTAAIVAGITAQVESLNTLAAAKREEARTLWRRASAIEQQGDDAHDEFLNADRVAHKLAALDA